MNRTARLIIAAVIMLLLAGIAILNFVPIIRERSERNSQADLNSSQPNQQQLPANPSPHAQPLVVAFIELPDGSRVDFVDTMTTLTEWSEGSPIWGHGTTSQSSFYAWSLMWDRPPVENGFCERTLAFSNLVSDPVRVTFTNGVPDRTNVVFKMHSK